MARLLVERAGPAGAGAGRNDSDGDTPEYLALLAGRNTLLMSFSLSLARKIMKRKERPQFVI